VSKKFRKIQDAHCILSGSIINGEGWMKQFVERLVNISHSQWLYRNFTLHHYAKGYLCQWAEKEIIEEVEPLADTRPSEINAITCWNYPNGRSNHHQRLIKRIGSWQ
jgi:hypothetical protein